VQVHRPHTRIADYVRGGGRVDIYRLADIQQLSSAESRLLSRILIDHFVRRGVCYDLGGALLSGTRAFQLTRCFPTANLDELFCSELVAAVLMRLGRMNHANPTRFSPGRLLRELVRQGTYRRLSEEVGPVCRTGPGREAQPCIEVPLGKRDLQASENRIRQQEIHRAQ
jgi:hypothetical protein